MTVPLSILDLSPITEGGSAGQSLRNTIDLAGRAEQFGYRRYWVAEHHNMPGIASAATSVVIAHIASATSTIRVGAGGIMLPNHAPLVIAEQFGTLAALHPGRIDLGLGRAPGTDQRTARALRRTLESSDDEFPRDVVELMHYFSSPGPDVHVRAVPGEGLEVPVWILGSSLFGAQLAAMLGLPYAFASHFAPGLIEQAPAIYRERFEPSTQCAEPHVMLGLNVCAAETDEDARLLFSSHQQMIVMNRTGRPGRLPPPVADYEETIDPATRALLTHVLPCSLVGSPETIETGLAHFIENSGADEIMVTGQIYDHEARRRSFEIVAEAHRRIVANSEQTVELAE